VSIHPTAIVDPKAEIDSSVEVGPFSIIGPEVKIGRGTRLKSHVVVEGLTEIGEDCTLYPFAAIGLPPQDLKYKNEQTALKVGNRNTIREYVTLHLGTNVGGGITRLGSDNYLMAYAHIAHDCNLGNRIIMANAATLAGCITIGDDAIIGGLVGVHQFVRVGTFAMIGGCAAVAQDVPPFVRVAGNHAKPYGLNSVGLKRHGFSPAQIQTLKGVYKLLFRAGLTQREALRQAREKWPGVVEVETFLSFVESSERGICR